MIVLTILEADFSNYFEFNGESLVSNGPAHICMSLASVEPYRRAR
jgi:hypothetical protein